MTADLPTAGESDICMNNELKIFHREKRVEISGIAIDLTSKEYALLSYFAANPGKALTRKQLLAEIWGFDFFGETRTVDAHVWSLRRKLGAAADIIETIHGVGYRFRSG